MVLLAEIYCPEQIVIPEHLCNVLKQYAKAVIRTQPFDVLRWSAAYFRCLALEVPPPVKPRYEPEARHGALTAGIVRVLIDQLGKGYYVQKKVLLEKWEALCLPEADLLNVLSLLRMLNWSQLHWLKIVAVFVGLLCDCPAKTAERICDILTEDPDGGPSAVPLWMFRECFLTVARLDCGSQQTFVDGRKVLDEEGTLEEPNLPTALPKVLSTISFKNAIIDKYRSVLESAEPDGSPSEDDKVSELSTVPSRLESDFKFLGDESEVTEVLRRAPDFDSVIVLLKQLRNDGGRKALNVSSLSETQLERARERSRQIEELRATLPDDEYDRLKEQERQELLKDMGPPWLLLYLFSRDTSRLRSFNYVEQSSTSLSDESASVYSLESPSDEPEVSSMRRKSSYSLPATVRARMSVSSHSASLVANEILSKVVCTVDEAILDGECDLSIASISSFLERKCTQEDEFISSADHETLQSFLKDAESRELVVNDLNELYHFFVSESFTASLEAKQQGPREIFSIFGESGIDVDTNLLEAKIADNMIIGLVPKPDEPEQDKPEAELESEQEPEPMPGPSVSSMSLAPPTPAPSLLVPQDETTQTNFIEIKCRTDGFVRPVRPAALHTDASMEHSCKLSPMSGIGGPLDDSLIDAFLAYLDKRAAHQQGLIYPRNFREAACPKIDSNGST